jgi:tetratricopeptide (TPR) repeat protein
LFKWFKRKQSASPLRSVLEVLIPQAKIDQKIIIHASRSDVREISNQLVVHAGDVSQAQLNDAIGRFKLGIVELPVLPVKPARSTTLDRPLVVVFADTLERAPGQVIDWLKRLAAPMFEEYLLLIAAGQEPIEKLLTRPLGPLDDEASRKLLGARFGLFERQQVDPLVRLARGIPQCLCLAGEFLQQASEARLGEIAADDVEDHLVSHYLVRSILRSLPDSSTDKHLLIYGCCLRRWETVEQLRTILFSVPKVRAIIGESADLRAAWGRLRERSFLTGGMPHPTLRDLLLHDLEQEEPSVLTELHRSAAAWYERAAQHTEEAVYHALAVGGWETALRLWRAALERGAKAEVEALLPELNGRVIPPEHALRVQTLTVESGLLLEAPRLLAPILDLLMTTVESAERAAAEALARRVIDAVCTPAELRLRLHIALAAGDGERDSERAHALIELGSVLRLQWRAPEAEAALREALALFEALADPHGRAYALFFLAETAADLRDRARGQAYLAELEAHLMHPANADVRHLIKPLHLNALRARLAAIADGGDGCS